MGEAEGICELVGWDGDGVVVLEVGLWCEEGGMGTGPCCWGLGQGVDGWVFCASFVVCCLLGGTFWLNLLGSHGCSAGESESCFSTKVEEIRLKRSVVGVGSASTIPLPVLSAGVGESNGQRPSNREIKVARAVLRRGTITNRFPFSTKCG